MPKTTTGLSRAPLIGMWFAAASVAMTASTAFVIWFGHGGHPPLTIADAYIFFAEWPMVLLHGIDFEVFSGQAFLVNMVGWSFIGLLLGALFPRSSSSTSKPSTTRNPISLTHRQY
jgi:hypothetical protein